MRGRVQVHWQCTNQVSAGLQRDWLNLQLLTRGYIAETSPITVLFRDDWLAVADIGFDTTTEGDVVRALYVTRMNGEPSVLAGSYVQFHHCDHDSGVNACSTALTRTVKT